MGVRAKIYRVDFSYRWSKRRGMSDFSDTINVRANSAQDAIAKVERVAAASIKDSFREAKKTKEAYFVSSYIDSVVLVHTVEVW